MQVLSEGNCLHPLEYHRYLAAADHAKAVFAALRDAYALSAFVGIAPQLQRARILARNGEEGLRRFETRWIPLENAYIAACGVERACGFRLSAE